MRPELVGFSDGFNKLADGVIYIDPAFKVLPEVAAILAYENMGLHWLQLFILVYHPRSPINPDLAEVDRIERAYQTMRSKTKFHLKGTTSYTRHEKWQALRTRWLDEFEDPLAERVNILRRKLREFRQAMEQTSPRQIATDKAIQRNGGKKTKEIVDSEGEVVFDNSEVMISLSKAYTIYAKDYADAVVEMQKAGGIAGAKLAAAQSIADADLPDS